MYYHGDERQLRRKCVMPWYVARLDMYGNITPCRGFVAANVLTKTLSFGKVWNNQQLRGYRNELAQAGVFPDCGRCCHRQYQG